MPGRTGAWRRASAIRDTVELVMARPRRAPEMVAGLQPEALARSVAFQPRRASSRSSRSGLSRIVIAFATGTAQGYMRTDGGCILRPTVASLRLTERQWRIYLAIWLVSLAAVAGVVLGLTIPGLMSQPPPAQLGGGVVIDPNSVAAPDFSLLDQRGDTVALSELRGTVIALTFLDTKCTNLCPLQARFLGSVESDLGPNAHFVVVVVSVRPEADTPATIGAFASANGLGGRYYWLTGSRSQLSAVWNQYGVGVQAANGDLQHSSVIYLIDPSGYERVGFLDVPEATAFENDVRILEKTK
jgi:protein SCO1